MNISEIINKHKNDLPGYKLVGYSEIAVPILKVNTKCLVQQKRSLPIVQEFVLNLWNEGVEVQDIVNILALDKEVVDVALSKLFQDEYINIETDEVTERGENYLEDNILEALDEEDYTIYLDGLTGKIVSSKGYMHAKVAKEKEVRTIKSLIKEVLPEDIDFKQLKSEIYRQKSKKETTTVIVDNQAEVVEIIDVSKPKSFYNKVNIMILENEQQDYRILAYDGYKLITSYEEALIKLDKSLRKLLEYKIETYFESPAVKKIETYFEKKLSISTLDKWEIEKRINECFEQVRNTLTFVISLHSLSILNEMLICNIQEALKRGIKVKIYLTGRKPVNSRQEDKIKELLKKITGDDKATIINIPCYFNEVVIKDNEQGVLIRLTKANINLIATTVGIVEHGYDLDEEIIKQIEQEVRQEENIVKDKIAEIHPFVDKKEMQEMAKKIFKLAIDLDEYMYERDRVGWFNEVVAKLDEVVSIPLATDKNKFKVFIDIFNNNLVEKLEKNVEQKCKIKESKKVQHYFYNTFKKEYPILQYALHKVKIYRNKQSHDNLSSWAEKYYNKFLEEDLAGCSPELIKDGYLLLQAKIMENLHNSMKMELSKRKTI